MAESVSITEQEMSQSGDAALSKKRRKSSMHGDTSGPTIRRMSKLEPRPSITHNTRRMSFASRASYSSSWGQPQTVKHGHKVANTYRLAPTDEEKFNASTAQRIMTNVMASYLEGEKYDKMLCTNLAKNLADVIKERMKDQGFSHRYKYVCMVTMGEKREQGMRVSSRCIWDTDTDNFASYTYTKGNLYAVATLYALYFE